METVISTQISQRYRHSADKGDRQRRVRSDRSFFQEQLQNWQNSWENCSEIWNCMQNKSQRAGYYSSLCCTTL